MPEENPAFYRYISDYFVFRRGKGVVLSSADHALLQQWNQAGVHRLEVMNAIDTAFRRARKAPHSLAAVRPYLALPQRSEEMTVEDLFEEPGQPENDEQTSVEETSVLVERLASRLDEWANAQHHEPAVRVAARELRKELLELEEEHEGVDTDTLLILDDAFALNIYKALSDERRHKVDIVRTNLEGGSSNPRERPDVLMQALRETLRVPEETLSSTVYEWTEQ